MPIYAYKCASCGFAKDVLQKLSDAPLTVCPSCGQAAFTKQLTAAGFQLKGSGWYVTDFRDGNKGGSATKDKADKAPAPASGGAGSGGDGAAAAPSPAPAASGSAPAPASAPSGSTAAPAPSGGGSSGGSPGG